MHLMAKIFLVPVHECMCTWPFECRQAYDEHSCEEEEKAMYYSITAEMIIAQPSSHPVTDNNPGTLAARV